MKKFSLGLLSFIICSAITLKAQVTIPGVGTVTESQLQSVGLSESEVNAVLNQPAAAPPPAGILQPQTQPAANNGQPAAPSTTEIQQVIQETPANTPAQAEQVIQQTTTPDNNPPQAQQAGAIFGQDFFRNGDITLFDKVPNAKVSDGYILGSGDQLSISVWGGVSAYNQSFTINDDGYINPEGLGRIYLKGLTFGSARDLLKQRYSTYINLAGSNFDVSLIYAKSIKVNIVGEVVNPGSYTISSINTAFNALVAAGGPTDIGSVRNIVVKRNNQVIKTLDVYQFLMNPGTADDTYLENNDYIIVYPLGRIAQVGGEINRPAKYELINGENLNELIYYGGGLKSTAYKRNVTVNRYFANENNVLDINLDTLSKLGINFEILNGDNVTFAKIPEILENIVSIQGAVRFPGTYQLTENLRISDVIQKAKGLTYQAYTDRAYLIRKDEKLNDVYIPFNLQDVVDNPNSPFNFKLAKFDVIDIFSKDKFRQIFSVQIQGAVKAPGTFSYYDKMTLKDLIYYSGGLNVEAANSRIEISRILNFNEAVNQDVPTRVVIETVEVNKNLEIADNAQTFQLQPYDIVFVRTTPEFELQKNIVIQGEVVYPGTYTLVSKTETINDVITRAGGLTKYAYVKGATLIRNNASTTLLFLDKAMKNPDSKYNYVLHEGDVVNVPKQGDLISMKGAIRYPFTGEAGVVMVPFEKGKTAKHFVKKYGKNFADNAERKETYIVQPNGYVKRTFHIWFIKFYPRVKVKGSEIVVPVEPVKPEVPPAPPAPKAPFDWNTFTASMMAGIISFATIFILIQNGNRR